MLIAICISIYIYIFHFHIATNVCLTGPSTSTVATQTQVPNKPSDIHTVTHAMLSAGDTQRAAVHAISQESFQLDSPNTLSVVSTFVLLVCPYLLSLWVNFVLYDEQ